MVGVDGTHMVGWLARWAWPHTAVLLAAAAPQAANGGPPHTRDASQQRMAMTALRGLSIPMHFEPLESPDDDTTAFVTRGRGYSAVVRSDGIVSRLGGPLARPGRAPATVRLVFEGADVNSRTTAGDPLPTRMHYYPGSNPARWREHVPTYADVRCRDVYPGVDVVYYHRDGLLEYDFVLAPGVSPDVIRLRIDGAEQVEVTGDGDLLLRLEGGCLRQRRPVAHQTIDGARRNVDAAYALDDRSVRLVLGPYDRQHELTIDPVLEYSTLFGGNAQDEASGIGVDAAGNIYIAGHTTSTDLPAVVGAATGEFAAFVAKFDSAGQHVHTALLGHGVVVRDLSVTPSGLQYFIATSSHPDLPTIFAVQSFPAGYDPIDPPVNGVPSDAYIAGFNADGTLIFGTYLGGLETDLGFGIAARESVSTGFVTLYVTGETLQLDVPSTPEVDSSFPVTPNAAQPLPAGVQDAFVARIAVGVPISSVEYGTYLGGSFSDTGHAIDFDNAGRFYVTGVTRSTDFPMLNPVHFDQPMDDAFAAGYAANGQLLYSTYLGGCHDDQGLAVSARKEDGLAYYTGATSSINFPTTEPAFQPQSGGSQDAFVVGLRPDGSVRRSTYFGGAAPDHARDIFVNAFEEVTICGQTSSPTTLPQEDAWQAPQSSGGFVTRFSASGLGLAYSSMLGGPITTPNGLALSGSGQTCVTGIHKPTGFNNTFFIFTPDAQDSTLDGASDTFLTVIEAQALPVPLLQFADPLVLNFPLGGQAMTEAAFADSDGDGDLDLHVSDTANRVIVRFVNQGGMVADEFDIVAALGDEGLIVKIFFVDVDCDDDLDLMVQLFGVTEAGPFHRVLVFNNIGGGQFDTNPVTAELPTAFLAAPPIDLADLNLDGKPDAVGLAGDLVFQLMNDTAGGFPQSEPVANVAQAADVKGADVDGDGLADISAALNDGRLTVLFNLGNGAPFDVQEVVSEAAGEQLLGQAVGQFDCEPGDDVAMLVRLADERRVVRIVMNGGQLVREFTLNQPFTFIHAATSNPNLPPQKDNVIVQNEAFLQALINMGGGEFAVGPETHLFPPAEGGGSLDAPLAFGDFDDDGREDVVYLDNVSASVFVFRNITGLARGDADDDGDVDLDDWAALASCLAGPDLAPPDPVDCRVAFDFDEDNDVDLADAAEFNLVFGSGLDGACCFGDGTCSQEAPSACAASGGTYHGDGTSCSPSPCPPPAPTGACCASNGGCARVTQSECEANPLAVYQGDDTNCTPNPCPPPPGQGACCFLGFNCIVTSPSICTNTFNGTYVGDGVACSPTSCAAGACCLPDGACAVLPPGTCTSQGGEFQGGGTDCSPDPCP